MGVEVRGSFHQQPKKGCKKTVAGIVAEELPCLGAAAEAGNNTD